MTLAKVSVGVVDANGVVGGELLHPALWGTYNDTNH